METVVNEASRDHNLGSNFIKLEAQFNDEDEEKPEIKVVTITETLKEEYDVMPTVSVKEEHEDLPKDEPELHSIVLDTNFVKLEPQTQESLEIIQNFKEESDSATDTNIFSVFAKHEQEDTTSDSTLYPCNQAECNKVVFTKQEQEDTTSDTTVYPCNQAECNKVYTTLPELTAHIEKTHNSPQKDFKGHKCTESGCQAVFSRRYRLSNHIQVHHNGIKPFPCPIENCSKSYSNEDHVKRHIRVSHLGEKDKEVACTMEGCNLNFSNKYNMQKHYLRAHINVLACDICQVRFRRLSTLNVHKKDAHEKGPYKCSRCPKVFDRFRNYSRHEKSCLIKDLKSYKCKCDEICSGKAEYVNHVRTECPLPKAKFQCDNCEKSFVTERNLKDHYANIHSPDCDTKDVFVCTYEGCFNNYKYKRNLSYHIKMFHEKMFDYQECLVCGRVLKSKKNFKRHLEICQSRELS